MIVVVGMMELGSWAKLADKFNCTEVLVVVLLVVELFVLFGLELMVWLVIIVGLMEFVGSLVKFLSDVGFVAGKLICRELLGITLLLVGCLVVIGVRLVGLLTVIVGE